MRYSPINYARWDFSGFGKNIISFLKSDERAIWDSSFPYQDKRNDLGHVETVTYFALKLLKYFDCERRVVIPAAILHDIGWSQMSKTELKLFYDKNWKRYEPVLRARHQEEGAKLAEKRLEKQNYSSGLIEHICEIISQHDTRQGFYSLEDGIVRSADRLWRFTLPHLKLAMKQRKMSVQEVEKWMSGWFDQENFFYDPKIKEIARIERDAILKTYRTSYKNER